MIGDSHFIKVKTWSQCRIKMNKDFLLRILNCGGPKHKIKVPFDKRSVPLSSKQPVRITASIRLSSCPYVQYVIILLIVSIAHWSTYYCFFSLQIMLCLNFICILFITFYVLNLCREQNSLSSFFLALSLVCNYKTFHLYIVFCLFNYLCAQPLPRAKLLILILLSSLVGLQL